MIIALDGPSGVGKSTLSRALAQHLQFSCLDTGALYRCVALSVLRADIDETNEARVSDLARKATIRFAPPNKVFLNDTDVTDEIRSSSVERIVSVVAAYPCVRAALLEKQQEIGSSGNYVVEGRDIGSTVFPDAECKFFLTASLEARTRRRLLQNQEKQHGSVDEQEVRVMLAKRDAADAAREASPLVCPPDAVRIDTSDKSFEEVMALILSRVYEVCPALRKEAPGHKHISVPEQKPAEARIEPSQSAPVSDATAPASASDAPAPTSASDATSAPRTKTASSRFACWYERCWDLPMTAPAHERHINTVVASIVLGVVYAIGKLLFRHRCAHQQRFRELYKHTGVCVVSNHTSFLDVVFVYLSLWPRAWARFLGRSTLFENKPFIFKWLLSHVGVIPVKRDSADMLAVKRASRALKGGEVVCIMPEGTRRGRGSKKPRIHGGAALIARMGKAPLLPLCVRDAERIKEKGSWVRFPRITTEFGNPIVLSDFDFLPKDKRLEGATWYAMREIFALQFRIKPDEVDMPALFPDDFDFTPVFREHPIAPRSVDDVINTLVTHKA